MEIYGVAARRSILKKAAGRKIPKRPAVSRMWSRLRRPVRGCGYGIWNWRCEWNHEAQTFSARKCADRLIQPIFPCSQVIKRDDFQVRMRGEVCGCFVQEIDEWFVRVPVREILPPMRDQYPSWAVTCKTRATKATSNLGWLGMRLRKREDSRCKRHCQKTRFFDSI